MGSGMRRLSGISARRRGAGRRGAAGGGGRAPLSARIRRAAQLRAEQRSRNGGSDVGTLREQGRRKRSRSSRAALHARAKLPKCMFTILLPVLCIFIVISFPEGL